MANINQSRQASSSSASAPPPRDPLTVIKMECQRSLMALQSGQYAKSLRIMNDAISIYNSSALLRHIHSKVHFKIAMLMQNPILRQRHIRTALQEARYATQLSPKSVEFAHNHATLLYEYSLDETGYEMCASECERALRMHDPTDPALDRLNCDIGSSTPGSRINEVKGGLLKLIQKCNKASVEIWMSTPGNKDKFRVLSPNAP